MTAFLSFVLGLLFGGVGVFVLVAWRMRVPGEPIMASVVRPFSGGGPRPVGPR